jgi:DNA-binding transcriptional LysR family regulator
MAGPTHAKWDFTLRQLSIFVCAARAGNFARAAEQLGVSQPAVSGCIAILESRLGRRLFQRRPGATPLLTRDGIELLDMAEKLLDTSGAIRGDEAQGAQRRRRVRLCIGPLLRDVYLKPLLPILYRDHPEIELDLVPIIPLDEVQAQLDRGRVDLVVYTIGRSPDSWPNSRILLVVPTVMIGTPGIGARLASGEVTIEDLPFILPGTNRLSEHWIERQLGLLGISPRHRITYLDFPDVIQDMVTRGQGVTVLMREQVARAIDEGLLETFGPTFPPMHRVIARSPLAGPAARIVEDRLVAAIGKAATVAI